MANPVACSVTGSIRALTYHSENYLRPWEPFPVSRGTHLRIHTRFRNPESWQRFLEGEGIVGCWAFALSCKVKPMVKRTAREYVDLVLPRAPFPRWIYLPVGELHGL